MKRVRTIIVLLLSQITLSAVAQTLNPTSSINTPGSVNTLVGGYTFAYATSGSPWNGAFLSFGGFTNTYDCQLSTDYGPNGGNHISFRTRHGDISTWNSWNELYHSSNINKIDIDFNAKTLYSVNVYNAGNLWSKQIKVALANPWPDYVFHKDYKLPSLEATEQQILANGHLPGIPSAVEVAKNGIDVGEMNGKLLQKIEELTLYLINQSKSITELKSQNKDLFAEIEKIKTKP
ncbi:MAG: hypothetical protein V4594_17885 [Bacteroidota bacterium]